MDCDSIPDFVLVSLTCKDRRPRLAVKLCSPPPLSTLRALGPPANQRTACRRARHPPPTRQRGSRGALRRRQARHTRALKALPELVQYDDALPAAARSTLARTRAVLRYDGSGGQRATARPRHHLRPRRGRRQVRRHGVERPMEKRRGGA